MKDIRKFAATSNMVRVRILDSSKTDGSGLTGLAYNTAGLVIDLIADNSLTAYHYKSAAAATIQAIATIGTFQAPSASNCRFGEVDPTNFPGLYEIHFLDGCFDDAGCKRLIGEVKGPANCTPTTFEIQLALLDPDTAGLAAATVTRIDARETTGGTITVGAGAHTTSSCLASNAGSGTRTKGRIGVVVSGGIAKRGIRFSSDVGASGAFTYEDLYGNAVPAALAENDVIQW